jgi:hypothetical protein
MKRPAAIALALALLAVPFLLSSSEAAKPKALALLNEGPIHAGLAAVVTSTAGDKQITNERSTISPPGASRLR